MFVTEILDLRYDLFYQRAVFNRLGIQTLGLSGIDLIQIVGIQTHDYPGALMVVGA